MITNPVKTFQSNLPDDNHCLQACVMMLANTLGQRHLTMAETETMTGFQFGALTWPYRAMAALAALGFEIRWIEVMDAALFTTDAIRAVGAHLEGDPATLERAFRDTDIRAEQDVVRGVLEHDRVMFMQRRPTFDDIHAELSAGGLVLCGVNGRRLYGKPGWHGHFVIVDAIDDNSVRVQNPGLPPEQNRTMSLADFEDAWASPNWDMALFMGTRRAGGSA